MRRLLLSAALAIPLFAGAALAAPTEASAARCSGVWVVVDYGALGGTSTRCAAKYSTGTEALRSAGFSPTLDGGMITRISGKPSSPDVNKAYWSYWQAAKSGDGYGSWSYSNLGSNDYHPRQGDAEGWRYVGLNDGNVAPAVFPPKADAGSPTPAPTATRKPTPKPTTTRSATTRATATATATKAATKAASASASPTAPSTTTASATPSPVTTPLSDGRPSGTAPDVAQPAEPAGGSPVGAIAAGVAVVGGAAGLGGWYLLRGRKR